MIIIQKEVSCKHCGDFLCNFSFDENHKTEVAILFTRCPKCGDGFSVDMENITVGELVEVTEA